MEEPQGPPDSLQREFARERLKNARRANAIRFWGVSAFFLLFLVLGGLLRLPAWSGNLWLFTLYWLARTGNRLRDLPSSGGGERGGGGVRACDRPSAHGTRDDSPGRGR